MKLLKQYEIELEKARAKIEELEGQNEQDKNNIETHESEYQTKVDDFDLEGAEKVKQKIKSIESRIEVRKDFIQKLEPSNNQKLMETGVQAINDYAKEKENLIQKGRKLEDKLNKKKGEYLDVIKK